MAYKEKPLKFYKPARKTYFIKAGGQQVFGGARGAATAFSSLSLLPVLDFLGSGEGGLLARGLAGISTALPGSSGLLSLLPLFVFFSPARMKNKSL